ncbi:hypothetical protein HPB51_009329 [Rhipicephalus microplus]|uniref:Tyrosine-protein kinase PR2 n=1 Tax=Rhipicephalus microplus TaxID=6941 RepID=A0A9J6F0P6_RHIMP|nr:hypothetical protein HPB51_009329 [Rhipicephalus microplus]
MILPKAKDDMDQSSVLLLDTSTDKGSSTSSQVRVPSKHIIPADSIVINKELGIGEFGVVQQGVWTNEEGDRIQVAIKCLSKDQMQNNPMEFLKEAVIMHTIDHEHIVRLYGVVLDTVSLMLVTELAPLRSLLECLKEAALRPSFPVMALCDFAMQICDGMQYLESKRLIHRDLAARNILVFAKNKVKISDFGLSRALGVGKDYYQTNFNVNLKLPIAWCAPECINFLRFTSASDVWAFGVTLWEMFSYGFQPWAALTGQQILEAIDEPNLQRLEQPDCCPKDYYALMLKCWQHDPNKRPKFSEILQTLPDCKPEQVQAIADCLDTSGSLKLKKDALHYRTGDVITVLDKRRLQSRFETPASRKAHPCLPHPSWHSCITRQGVPEGLVQLILDHSRNRVDCRMRPDAWSLWKGVTAAGKTGLFNPAATIAYLGHNLPSSRASGSFTRFDPRSGAGTAYASGRRSRLRPEMISGPQGDLKHTGHIGLDGAFFGDVGFLGDKYGQLPKQVVNPYKPQEDKDSSDSSDMTPLLNGSSSTVDGKSGPALETWSDTSSEKDLAKEYILEKEICAKPLDLKLSNPLDVKSMSGKEGQKSDHEYHEISDEEQVDATESPKFETLDLGPSLMDEVFRALETTQLNFDLDKVPKDDCFAKSEPPKETPKPSSAGSTFKKKQLATVKPISAAEEQTLETAIAIAKEAAAQSMQEMDGRSESDATQDSPRTPSSPNKRKFSFKFKSSPKLGRRTFSEEAEAIPDIQDSLTEEAKEAYNSLVDKGPEKLVVVEPTLTPAPVTGIEPLDAGADVNPLRRIRSGIQIQPRVRGNRHGIPSSCRPTTPHTAALARLAANAVSSGSAPRNGLGAPPPPPLQQQAEAEANPLPLPPRDRTKPAQVLKHHQRKHPLLLLPGSVAAETACKDSSSESPPAPVRQASVNERIAAVEAKKSIAEPRCPPTKPVRTSSNPDESFENQIQEGIDSLDHLATDAPSLPTIYKNSDHVSCEDLLEFAMDRPNAKRLDLKICVSPWSTHFIY